MGLSSTIETHSEDEQDDLKMGEYSNYEVGKYRQSNVKPLQLPSMPASLR